MTIASFKRHATAADYQWNDTLEKYVLSFDERLVLGTLTDDPEEGAAVYNAYIEQGGEEAEQAQAYQDIQAIYQQCTQDAIGTLSSAVYANCLLNAINPDKYPMKQALVNKLTPAETKVFIELFCRGSLVHKALSEAEQATLASMYC